MMEKCTVAHMHRYPMKSFNGETLEEVTLRAGELFPGDRALAIAKVSQPLEQNITVSSLLTLSAQAPFQGLRIAYDEKGRYLRLFSQNILLAEGHLGVTEEKAALEHALGKALGTSLTPQITQRTRESFAFRKNLISLINLDTVDALSERLGFAVDALRFRANIYFRGAAPWEEMDWVGRTLYADGPLKFTVREVTRRCLAIDVNPHSGDRDVDLLEAMRTHLGHVSLGIYAEVSAEGVLRTGDSLHFP